MVGNDEIGPFRFTVGIEGIALGPHGMAIDVVNAAEAFMQRRIGLGDGGVIGLPIALDPPPHLVTGELARVKRFGAVQPGPDQALADAAFFGRPGISMPTFDLAGIDVVFGTVGIHISARKTRGDKHRAKTRRGRIKLVDEGVLHAAQLDQFDGGVEIVGIGGTAMRAVEQRRYGFGRRRDDGYGFVGGFSWINH